MVKFKFFILFLFVFALNINLSAQEKSVKAFTDSTRYYVGDYIYLHLEVKHDKTTKINIPNIKDSLENIEILASDKKSQELENNLVLDNFTYTLAKYDSGSFNLPKLKIDFIDNKNNINSLYTNKLVIDVTTLEVKEKEEIRDVKEPLKIPVDWIFVLMVVLIIIIILIIAYYIYRYYLRKQQLKQGLIPEVKIPPYEIALTKLRELEDKKLWQKGEIKEYHTEITFIVRNYFEQQFKFNALEMTSAEIISFLKQSGFNSEIYATLDNFFANADMVKFAKFHPMWEINEKMLKESYFIIEKSRDSLSYKEEKEVIDGEVGNV